MARPSPTYRGDAPYVFVCYAHANMDEVYAEIEWLQAHDIHVWYDEGISAGAEWREELGDAIRDCHLFLFFVSPEATASRDCRRELNLALEYERPTLAVYLSETEMSSGLYLSLADRQAILRYAETDADYREKLLDSVSRAVGSEVPVATGPVHRARRRSAGRWRQITGAVAIVLMVGGLGWYLGRTGMQQTGPSAPQITRFRIDTDRLGPVAVAPDGSSIAYVNQGGAFVRALDELEPRAVPGGADPLYSPDGKWLVHRRPLAGQIMRVPVEGGAPSLIFETTPAPSLGGCWLDADTLVFADNEGLHRGSVTDGEVTLLLKPDPSQGEEFFAWPSALPDGHTVLFTVLPRTEDRAHITALDLASGERTVVLRGATSARFVPTGHLVYFDDARRALMGVRFHVSTLAPQGEPVRVIESEIMTSGGGARFDLSSNGTLAYVASSLAADQPLGTSLVWVDRDGNEAPTNTPRAIWLYPRLSPDARAVASEIYTLPPPTFRRRRDLYVWSFERGDMTRLTDEPTEDGMPVWSRDGRTVFFASNRDGVFNVYSVPVDGASAAERLLQSSYPNYPTALSPDGRLITMFGQGGRLDIGAITLGPPVTHAPLLVAPEGQANGVVSPDGRWLAYESDISGQNEVYVRPLTDPSSRRWKVSVDGGAKPRWSRHTDEIYYVSSEGDMMATAFNVASEFEVGMTVRLFAGKGYAFEGGATTYDVSPVDGRFLVRKAADEAVDPADLHVVVNWFEELKRLLPN
jgi:Tol biopolymer transport system component